MIDLMAAKLALRNRALGLVVATTGLTTLSATATGYARTLTGAPGESTFLTEGFDVGMELVPAGFAANTLDVITGVSAAAITVKNARAVEVAASGRSLSVGVPLLRSWEMVGLTPVAGRPYVEEEFVHAAAAMRTFATNGGQMHEEGLYILKWYGVSTLPGFPVGIGDRALRKQVDALRARFAPGTVAGPVQIDPEHAPYTGQLIQLTGWGCLILTAPWRARSRNAVLA